MLQSFSDLYKIKDFQFASWKFLKVLTCYKLLVTSCKESSFDSRKCGLSEEAFKCSLGIAQANQLAIWKVLSSESRQCLNLRLLNEVS